jgi:hypothetical protein
MVNATAWPQYLGLNVASGRHVRPPEEAVMNPKIAKILIPLAGLFLLIALYLAYPRQAKPEKVSEFSRYQGYSEAVYNGSKRTSDFLTLSDETLPHIRNSSRPRQ